MFCFVKKISVKHTQQFFKLYNLYNISYSQEKAQRGVEFFHF